MIIVKGLGCSVLVKFFPSMQTGLGPTDYRERRNDTLKEKFFSLWKVTQNLTEPNCSIKTIILQNRKELLNRMQDNYAMAKYNLVPSTYLGNLSLILTNK